MCGVLQRRLRNDDALILVDFKLQYTDWQTLTGFEGDSHRMPDFVEPNCLSQMVSEPTRDNILDLVLATQENLDDNGCDHRRTVRLDLRAQSRIAEN